MTGKRRRAMTRTYRVIVNVPHFVDVEAETPEQARQEINGYKLRAFDTEWDSGFRLSTHDVALVTEMSEGAETGEDSVPVKTWCPHPGPRGGLVRIDENGDPMVDSDG
jgi:hypothetical protein